ncbi:16S rRNA pseudouridine(516) synthase [Streptococcus caprae]|uniref:Pseudouridine synthase n=1 Tax=Streptococcus caprae TaxID=1640501 RepID=A0ABV8CT61_9STRE
MRLDKLLEIAELGSKNQVKKLLKSRQVTVDGQIVTRSNAIVDAGLQDIRVARKQVTVEGSAYFLLNKPQGVVSAVRDDQFDTVIDCLALEDQVPGLYPVGRLDRDTEGLMLLTNNGPLGFRMLHPQYHVTKTYYVEVNGLLGEDAAIFFKDGVVFEGGRVCKPADLQIVEAQAGLSKAYVTISEGSFHQVKKMCLAYGVKVTYLKRISFGSFVLEDDLLPGHYRELTLTEQEKLKDYFG